MTCSCPDVQYGVHLASCGEPLPGMSAERQAELAVIAAAERWHDQADKWGTFDGDAYDYTAGEENACDALFDAVQTLRLSR